MVRKKKIHKKIKKIDIESIKKLTGLKHIEIIKDKKGYIYLKKNISKLYIDLSTLGEGFAVDKIIKILEKEKITNYLISVGGAVFTSGKNYAGKKWKIAIQNPTDKENKIQKEIIEIQNFAVSTAGNYRNYYKLNEKNIHHIINPKTGYPIKNNLLSVTVIASSGLEADAWDTALMVLGLKKSQEIAIREKLAVYIIWKEKNKIINWISPQFKKFIKINNFIS